VLEVALGGGEVLLRDDALDVVDDVRARGMVPNLTISGFGLTDDKAARLARTVGQVNVSLDGLGETYGAVRGWEGASVGLRAIRRLREAGARVGVNTVLTRANVAELDRMADTLAELGVVEWQWLRFKPAGRGADAYARLALDPVEASSLWPRLLAIETRTGLVLRMDCALVPFLVAHGPPVEHLERLAVSGCPGGESLWSRTADGRWAPCSFAHGDATPADGDVARTWREADGLRAWRERAAAPPEPCGSCSYRAICRGGCRIVAAHLTGDALAPDPECPRVRRAA
jgi:radical SAM protein with 4Fe4S-binding SPASM domain